MEDQEVRDQQRMLNQEEQRRILEENAQRKQTRIQRMEIIQEITDLEREREKTTNRLRRSCNQTLSKFNFRRMEDLFIASWNLTPDYVLGSMIGRNCLTQTSQETPSIQIEECLNIVKVQKLRISLGKLRLWRRCCLSVRKL